jgi:hypothetical protein
MENSNPANAGMTARPVIQTLVRGHNATTAECLQLAHVFRHPYRRARKLSGDKLPSQPMEHHWRI